ncbi:unnamed protein product [Hymenolepis diminuta]|uniref:Lipoprotein n=1 Tax=Hymenolepis diminuta TaxID=6216 RepID=A0A0R3S7R6_HYMDI|nr:unnamed protein product [Hymenolepis diminuta]
MKRERRSPLLSPLLGHAIPDLSTAPSSLSGCQCLQGDDTDDVCVMPTETVCTQPDQPKYQPNQLKARED